MKDELIRVNVRFNIVLVFWLVMVYVIWREEVDIVIDLVNGMFIV